MHHFSIHSGVMAGFKLWASGSSGAPGAAVQLLEFSSVRVGLAGCCLLASKYSFMASSCSPLSLKAFSFADPNPNPLPSHGTWLFPHKGILSNLEVQMELNKY